MHTNCVNKNMVVINENAQFSNYELELSKDCY